MMKFSRFKRRGEGNVPEFRLGQNLAPVCYEAMAPKVSSKQTARIPRFPQRRIARPDKTAAELVQRIAEEMERLPPETFEGIPDDASKNVEHYLYGSSKQR